MSPFSSSIFLLPPPFLSFILSSFYSIVLNKGQCVTKYYRWIQKNGGYIWIQSSATIAINAKNGNEKNIIWVNYVLRYTSLLLWWKCNIFIFWFVPSVTVTRWKYFLTWELVIARSSGRWRRPNTLNLTQCNFLLLLGLSTGLEIIRMLCGLGCSESIRMSGTF